MKQKAKPQSKIPTTGRNTNQKKSEKKAEAPDYGGSLLKKNEFTLIIVGALVVTILVFFLFFRASDENLTQKESSAKDLTAHPAQKTAAMETRVADLEVEMARMISASSTQGQAANSPKGLSELDQRVSRLETAMSVKLDALIGRMATLEKKMDAMKYKVSSAPVKRPAVSVKKTSFQPKPSKSLFHTVKKGETLWFISQKYKISVTAIRKLNNLSAKDKIYPGNNILVR
ncbi:MAG: LysM peptidoglycan-binding domain-containing protein [Desulfobacter sp.]|nr:LysM peptidoglycan-binding domain-containing protein [Desulfobacter sp.]